MSKDFRRHDSHKFKRLSPSWRKPRGLHNKVRLEKKGYVKKVKIGYGTSRTKPKVVIVSSIKDIYASKGTEGTEENIILMFSSALGKKKKADLLKIAQDANIKIANSAHDFIKKLEEEMQNRKKKKEERKKEKTEKQKDLDKKAKEKEKKDKDGQALESKLTDKEKKEQEKKEKDKLLTKKEGM